MVRSSRRAAPVIKEDFLFPQSAADRLPPGSWVSGPTDNHSVRRRLCLVFPPAFRGEDAAVALHLSPRL